jgi:hypothetical protein
VGDDYGSKYRVEIFSGASGRVLKEPFNPDYQERQSHCSTPTLVIFVVYNTLLRSESERQTVLWTRTDIFRLAKNPRFISGIYNYCDRWCERCPFTSRCLTYAIDAGDNDDPTTRDLNNEAFWNKLQSIFKQTAEMIKELAEEMGIDLNSLDIESVSDDISLRREKAHAHEIVIAARNYAKMVDNWFESEGSLSEQKQDELSTLLKIGLDENGLHAEAAGIQDAVEVIRWYQHQIEVKLRRALTHDDLFDEEEDAILQNDANGSVKVALLGMDRSIGAWGKLQGHFPEKTDSILDILLNLDRLRRRTKELFPQARSFKRPGFDT